MLYSCQNGVSGDLPRRMPAVLLVSVCLALTAGLAKADPTIPAPERASVTWIAGPTNLVVGDLEIEVMTGWKFTDAAGAQALLSPQNSLPRGLAGFLASNAQDLGLVLAVDRVGHVTYEAVNAADYAEILKKAQAQKGIIKADWEIAPEKGPLANSVHWEIKAQTAKTEPTLNYSVQVLGRRSVLTMTAFFRGATRPEDLLPLITRVGFRKGEQYADFKEAKDTASKLTLAQVAVHYAESETETSAVHSAGGNQLLKWGGLSLAAALVIAALVVAVGKVAGAVKKLRPVEEEAYLAPVAEDLQAGAKAEASNGHGGPAPVRNGAHKNGAGTSKGRNGRLVKVINGLQKGRKREFDYNRYFADLMATVSTHGITMESANAPTTTFSSLMAAQNGGQPVAAPEVNGNGHSAVAPVTVNSEILSCQTTLIEEQRRLIHEQGKLIEEKSRLISEKNALLQIQREMLDQKVL